MRTAQGIPTDFVNVWAAGRLVLEGHPALAYDWEIQKQVELALLRQDFLGYFAWHYPPPFLFVASLLAQFPYAVAFIGWVVGQLPALSRGDARDRRPAFGLVLAAAFPIVFNNALVGQNGFLTAALIGGTLYLMPMRPVLAGICLGLLSYKPQYGLLFPLVLIAASQWTVFLPAARRRDRHGVSCRGSPSAPRAGRRSSTGCRCSRRPSSPRARRPGGSCRACSRWCAIFGGTEQLAWIFQWILTAAVAVVLALMWRSRMRYSLKAAALAIGTC